MKRQIHAYRGHDEIAVEGHNIKLGRGGIREIEFFVQTQQLIAGGRHPELRVRETLATLDVLAAGGWIDARGARRSRRRLSVPARGRAPPADGRRRADPHLAGRSRRRSSALPVSPASPTATPSPTRCSAHLRNVQRHYATLFEHAPVAEAGRRDACSSRPTPTTATRSTSSPRMGFRQPLEVSALVRRWLAGGYRVAAQRARARAARRDRAARCSTSSRARPIPTPRVIAFDRFLAGLHGGGRLFSLLRQNPDLVALIALVLGTAPRLADSLAQLSARDGCADRSELLRRAARGGRAARRARRARSGRRRLTRTFSTASASSRQEQMFLIGTRILSGTVSAEQAGEAFARLADVLVALAAPRGRGRISRKLHGRVARPGDRGPGARQARRARDDRDLRPRSRSSIYDFDPEHPESERPAPALRQPIFRAPDATPDQRADRADQLRRCSTRSTCGCGRPAAPARWRPGSTALPSYQETEAWTWEHMALTRARVVSASPAFAARVESVIRAVLCRPRDATWSRATWSRCAARSRPRKARATAGISNTSAGGLIDIEFIAQYLQLVHAAEKSGHSRHLDGARARQGVAARRAGDRGRRGAAPGGAALSRSDATPAAVPAGPFDPKTAAPGLLGLLARAADVPDFATLDAFIVETETKVRRSFVRILGASP